MHNHFTEILLALVDAGVEYVVGGGVAAVLHGVERVTLDLDISVNMTGSNLDRLAIAVNRLGLKPRVAVAVDVLRDPEQVRKLVEEKHAIVFSFIDPSNPLRYLDLFLKEDLSYPVLAQDAVSIELDGRRVLVASAPRLLALKKAIQPPRDKDILDIAALERILNEEKH